MVSSRKDRRPSAAPANRAARVSAALGLGMTLLSACSANDTAGSGGSGGAGECVFDPPPHGDPNRFPLACTEHSHYVEISATPPAADTLELVFSWCGCRNVLCDSNGGASDLALTVAPELGTLLSWIPTCEFDPPSPSATIELASSVAEGDVVLIGQFGGLDACTQPLTCPIHNTYHVRVNSSGVFVTLSVP